MKGKYGPEIFDLPYYLGEWLHCCEGQRWKFAEYLRLEVVGESVQKSSGVCEREVLPLRGSF